MPTEKWGEYLLIVSSLGSLTFANKRAETQGHRLDWYLGHSPAGDLWAQVSPLCSTAGRNELAHGSHPLSPRKHENKVPTVPKSAPKAQALPGPTMAKPGKKVLGGAREHLLSCVSHQALVHMDEGDCGRPAIQPEGAAE